MAPRAPDASALAAPHRRRPRAPRRRAQGSPSLQLQGLSQEPAPRLCHQRRWWCRRCPLLRRTCAARGPDRRRRGGARALAEGQPKGLAWASPARRQRRQQRQGRDPARGRGQRRRAARRRRCRSCRRPHQRRRRCRRPTRRAPCARSNVLNSDTVGANLPTRAQTSHKAQTLCLSQWDRAAWVGGWDPVHTFTCRPYTTRLLP